MHFFSLLREICVSGGGDKIIWKRFESDGEEIGEQGLSKPLVAFLKPPQTLAVQI